MIAPLPYHQEWDRYLLWERIIRHLSMDDYNNSMGFSFYQMINERRGLV